jgi:pimeloyl-ACP methyl ester carboxylesterase
MERLRLSVGTELAFITEGEAAKPAVLLLHGTPNSSRMFREAYSKEDQPTGELDVR